MGFKTKNLLYLLVLIIVLGFLLYLIQDYILEKNLDTLQERLDNSENRIQLSAYLREYLLKVNADFIQLRSIHNKNTHDYIIQRINTNISNLNDLLDVIEFGGSYSRVITLNLVDIKSMVDVISYQGDIDSRYNIKILVLRTLLSKLKDQISIIEDHLEVQQMMILGDKPELGEVRINIDLFYNNMDPRFKRSEEYANKLYYDSTIENRIIKEERTRQKQIFTNIRVFSLVLILLFVLIISSIILKQVFKANLEIEKNEEKFRTFADFTHDWEYWIEPAGNYIYVSPSVKGITGYSAEDFYQDKDILRKIMHKKDLDKYEIHNRNRILNPADEEPSNFRIINRDGKVIWINHVCKSVYDKTGKILGIRGSNRDITTEFQLKNLLDQVTKANDGLKRSNEEKLLLMKESHHRIKNSLSITASLLKLQAVNMQNEEDSRILEESSSRIETMANLHSLLYKDDVAKVDIRLYFDEIISNLFKSYNLDENKLNIEKRIDNLSLSSKTATSCGLILNELLTNAYKYRLREKTDAILEIKFLLQDEGGILMSVYNDGDTPSSKEFDSHRTSFGLNMVDVLVEQLHGTLKIILDRGTEFIISFPFDSNDQ